jgi:glutathione synthase/RimK-type ligase-like ATP-grasp enzyme
MLSSKSGEMIIGIQPDRIGEESYSDKWSQFLKARGITTRSLDLLGPDVLTQVESCQGIMWRWAHNPQDKQSARRILYTIEHNLGIPVYPDSSTAWHYDEKIAQYYLLQTLEAPVPKTWLFWNHEEALAWSQTAPYPIVFKLSAGAGSANVLKVTARKEAVSLIERVFRQGIFPYALNDLPNTRRWPRSGKQLKALIGRSRAAWQYVWAKEYPPLHPVWWQPERNYAYFQEFLPGNYFDTRITVIGDRAFGFRRLNRSGDFRASGSGLIDNDPAAIDLRCIEIAFQISRRGKFQSMAYDFLYGQGEPLIGEISYAFADWAVHECPGHWREDLSWVDGQMWPEEAQVEDFISRIRGR